MSWHPHSGSCVVPQKTVLSGNEGQAAWACFKKRHSLAGGIRTGPGRAGELCSGAQAWQNILEAHLGARACDTEIDENRLHGFMSMSSLRPSLPPRHIKPQGKSCRNLCPVHGLGRPI